MVKAVELHIPHERLPRVRGECQGGTRPVLTQLPELIMHLEDGASWLPR